MKSTKIAAILEYISHNIYSTIRPELKMVYFPIDKAFSRIEFDISGNYHICLLAKFLYSILIHKVHKNWDRHLLCY